MDHAPELHQYVQRDQDTTGITGVEGQEHAVHVRFSHLCAVVHHLNFRSKFAVVISFKTKYVLKLMLYTVIVSAPAC